MCEAAARPMPYMTVMSGPKQRERMARLIKRLESRYALVLPIANMVRKIGSTTVALNVGEGVEVWMITRQLSQIDKLHYQVFVGDINSPQAFQSMEAFRKKEMI